MLVTDAQVHLWEAHRPDRPWPADQIGKPSFVCIAGARPHRAEPLDAEEAIALMDEAGVDRAVIVPPSPAGDSNATGLEGAARFPGRLAVMGRFNPGLPDARDTLRTWLDQPHMLGIRMTFHKPAWSQWLRDGSIEWFWQDCERLGIPLMLLAPGLIDIFRDVALRYPGLTLILDHMARRSELRDDACFADLDELLSLAGQPNVAVKLSAIPCYSTEPFPFANLAPYLHRIFDAFGPRRLMWGSDLTRLPCTYGECVRHAEELPFLTAEDRDWIMGRTAAELLHWPETAEA